MHTALLQYFCFAANLLARQWRKPDEAGREVPPRVFQISNTSTTFSQYYDEVQEWLKSMAGMDQMLPGTSICMYMHTIAYPIHVPYVQHSALFCHKQIRIEY